MTTFLLFHHGDHYAIVNDDADFIVGRVYPINGQGEFQVWAGLAPDWNDGVVGVVQYHSATPFPPLPLTMNETRHGGSAKMRRGTRRLHSSLTCGCSETKRAFGGPSAMTILCCANGAPAIFATREEAQRAADAHLLDYYPNYEIIDDGLLWVADPEIDWRSCPHRVEARARCQRIDLAA